MIICWVVDKQLGGRIFLGGVYIYEPYIPTKIKKNDNVSL